MKQEKDKEKEKKVEMLSFSEGGKVRKLFSF